MRATLRPVLVVIFAYLIGSIPFGYLLVRMKLGADIRQTGSGGTGATNVSRRAGKLAGVLTLFLDAAKGAVAVLLARSLLTEHSGLSWPLAMAAFAVIVGHIFPIWLGFRGGKGVATAVGVFLVLEPLAVAVSGILFILIVVTTRYVSLASILAAAAIPLFIWLLTLFYQPSPNGAVMLAFAIAAALLIIFAHRSNIARLVKGTESKFR
jgi:acyl phosphate:glycerol-3-phosphate acyltransferase